MGSDNLHAGLFDDGETANLVGGQASIDAMLRVEGALARAQGRLGLIPSEAAQAIELATREAGIDVGALAAGVARDGVPVPALLGALRPCIPEAHAQWLHWGATSQDIVDTGLALRLRAMLDLWEGRLGALLAVLARLAQVHAETPMAARTYGQTAVPTSFGAVAASWGRPLLRHRERIGALREDVLVVSLGGAAGTLSAMGPEGHRVRAHLARELDLRDPGHSWHDERDRIAALAAWMAGLCASVGKIGEDLILLAQSDVAEIQIRGAGGSSTMPQKENPVGPSVLVALARMAIGLAGVVQQSALHRQQRDGAAWFAEWLALPPLCIACGRALALAGDVVARLEPDTGRMQRNMEAQGGAIHAEAVSFALSRLMPRPTAQAAARALAREARETGGWLPDLARRDHPDLAWSGPGLGLAPQEARDFARAARQRPGP